ncbi:unnamed protein product [Prorocentrum cordatum]|uniref:Uncharacterized protein n=1 Tax=Prorocentrum cordatum TaxID=2364126 RepID=A0ABN9RMJ7_9DINO|nr:unnamed protein product [Polarella glacialis]
MRRPPPVQSQATAGFASSGPSLADELQGADTSHALDELLDAFQDRVARLKACSGSVVKLQGAEINVLESVGKAHDEMLEAMKRDPATGKSRVLERYGGDCDRVARMRSLLESVELTGKRQGDRRLAEALSRCETIEGILREAGLGKDLDTAQMEFSGALRAVVSEEPQKPQRGWRRPNGVPQAAQSAVRAGLRRAPTVNQVGCAGPPRGADRGGGAGPKHQVSVRTTALIEPKLDVGLLNKLVLGLNEVHVVLDMEVNPPLPKTRRPLIQHQELGLPVPDLQRVVFDKSKKTPPGASVSACAEKLVDLAEVPAEAAVDTSFASESPWWNQKVLVGGSETQLNCSAVLQGQFELEERPACFTSALRMRVTCRLECWLSGPGSALFVEDGEPRGPSGLATAR